MSDQHTKPEQLAESTCSWCESERYMPRPSSRFDTPGWCYADACWQVAARAIRRELVAARRKQIEEEQEMMYGSYENSHGAERIPR